jgi:hypothetical protein
MGPRDAHLKRLDTVQRTLIGLLAKACDEDS